MERAQKFYNCITEIGDAYIQDAEQFQPGKGKILNIDWRRWSSTAAAVLLLAGIGFVLMQRPLWGSSDAPATAAPSAPASSAPAASTPAAEESSASAPATPSTSSPAGSSGIAGNDYETYASCEELVQAADVIVEGMVVGVTADVEFEGTLFTVVDLTVSNVFKGAVEPGETIQVKLLTRGGETSLVRVDEYPASAEIIGKEWICFLQGDQGDDPDMPFRLINPSQGIIVVNGESVQVDGGIMSENANTSVSMDKQELIDILNTCLE